MGASQQRHCQLWITIQKKSKQSQEQLFDFNKEGLVLHSTKMLFPSYLHYYEQPNTVTFSLLKDHHNVFAQLDFNHIENTLYIGKIDHQLCGKIWKQLGDNDQVQIKQGTFMKLGRFELQVKEIQLITVKKSMKSLIMDIQQTPSVKAPPNNFLNSHYLGGSRFAHSRMKDSDVLSLSPSQQFMKKSLFTQRSSMQTICRFCFDSTSTSRNPLFSVCLCAGSVKNIHYQCLRSWVRNKMGKVQTSHCIYYHYEPMTCQLCKYFIKNDIMYEGKIYKLFEPQRIHPPYARFQYCEGNKVHEILVRLQESSRIQIGRGTQNDMNLNDPTIGRPHCSLFYTSRKLFLKGKNTKYGTFIQLPKSMQIRQGESLSLLIQNNLIRIDIKQEQKDLFSNQCCNVQNVLKIKVK